MLTLSGYCKQEPRGDTERARVMIGEWRLQRGAGRNRTDEWRFCRPLPYHLATAPEVR